MNIINKKKISKLLSNYAYFFSMNNSIIFLISPEMWNNTIYRWGYILISDLNFKSVEESVKKYKIGFEEKIK